MVAQDLDGLVEELALEPRACPGVLPPQLAHHFLPRLLAHVVVHVG